MPRCRRRPRPRRRAAPKEDEAAPVPEGEAALKKATPQDEAAPQEAAPQEEAAPEDEAAPNDPDDAVRNLFDEPTSNNSFSACSKCLCNRVGRRWAVSSMMWIILLPWTAGKVNMES